LDEIRIGLFAPTDGDHPVGIAMYEAAQLAIEEINAAGGFAGVPLRLMTRWDDDPWRGGSKQMTKLVYEDNVWAVIGSVSGEATHIAEQVITKAWVPLLSPVSADPTLTYIRIPWRFRLPPDDAAQAETIFADGLRELTSMSVGLITSTDHDGRIFAEEMLDQLNGAAAPPVFHFQLPANTIEYADIVLRCKSFDPDALVIRLPPSEMLVLLDQMHRNGVTIPVLIPWVPGLRHTDLERHYGGAVFSVRPFSTFEASRHSVFAKTYRDRYGHDPTPSGAYTYDAVNLIVRSLDKSGLNRSKMRDAIAGYSGYEGVTGAVRWDNAGGNKAQPSLVGRP
jgi:ABC-type branched-subunit amino acid transport system substrate-binding protein